MNSLLLQFFFVLQILRWPCRRCKISKRPIFMQACKRHTTKIAMKAHQTKISKIEIEVRNCWKTAKWKIKQKKRIELKIYGYFCFVPNGKGCISEAHTNIGHIIQTETKLHRNNNEMVKNHRSAACSDRRGIRAEFLLHNNAYERCSIYTYM